MAEDTSDKKSEKPEKTGGQKGSPGPGQQFDLPLLPLRNTVMFPHAMIPLSVGRERSITAVKAAKKSGGRLALITQKDPEVEVPAWKDLYETGTIVQIVKVLDLPDGTLSVFVRGISRFRAVRLTLESPYLKVEGRLLKESLKPGVETDAQTRAARNLANKVIKLSSVESNEAAALRNAVEAAAGAGIMADMIAAHLNFPVEEKQNLLDEVDVNKRLTHLVDLLNHEAEVLGLTRKIQSKARKSMEKLQREYYLREQLKAIRRELGEEESGDSELDDLRKRLDEVDLPQDARREADRELARLSRITMASPEYTVARTYLECLAELPWNTSTQDNLDITNAQRVLDEDHYGLEKIKERILEYLAVRKLKKEMKGPILCFMGPPGVGKTSLGMSIARALGRKFSRMSLGGLKDEAEIRGHRRTYIGALPGRIIQGIKKAGSNNPVFMLDEIDKVGADFRGDPSAALLEVLDPEQNDSFTDHYMEVAFDLSKVMFITTANTLDSVAPALADRMEVLELPGYTEVEKFHIANKFLMPKQLSANGLSRRRLHIHAPTMRALVSDYTHEAGVRQLERAIAEICRKVAKRVADGEKNKTKVRASDLHKYLGPPKHHRQMAERKIEPGVATALAWTPAGGEILFIEVTQMPGKGNLLLTGSLGEVMKESAKAAVTYVKSKTSQFGLDPSVFENVDFHIHVPAGAARKDGPSAGIAVFVALVSLLTNTRSKRRLAMTGEVTLRGTILPVGGIKQKVLAAKRAGIKEIILPKRNENDLADVPDEVKEHMTFHLVSKMDEVLALALKPGASTSKRSAKGTPAGKQPERTDNHPGQDYPAVPVPPG